MGGPFNVGQDISGGDFGGAMSPATGLGMSNQFKASSAPIINPVTGQQISQAYLDTQNALGMQAQFANAASAQNGFGNQSNVFGQMQGLAGQLQTMANGGGPNPALAQLANTTGQNVAGQAALMAGQRGASGNAGLMARQIAQQGAATQQSAAGQAAALQAQQQLAAFQALQQQQGMLAGVAGQQVAQQGNAIGGFNNAAQGEQGNLFGAVANVNNANVANTSNMNNVNSGVAQQNAQANGKIIGGAMNAAGGMFGLAHGGTVPGAGPSSFVGKHLHSYKSGGQVPGNALVSGDSPSNDTVKAKLSPGEIVIPRSITMGADAPKKAAAFVAAALKKRQTGA